MTFGQRNVRDCGIEDNNSFDTAAIQAALDDCAGESGEVYLPFGTYRSTSLRVDDDTTLRLANGAELRFVQDLTEFPTVESRWEGQDQDGFHPCLHVVDTSSVIITGGGVIDGGGSYWWIFVSLPSEQYPSEPAAWLEEIRSGNQQDEVSTSTVRPPLLQIDGCESVTVSDVTLRDSPSWDTHVVYSNSVMIHDVSIQNPLDAPNGDDIDIDSSRFIRVNDTRIDAGDDAIYLKSDKGEQGREVRHPTENVVITSCTVEHGHGGVVIGSETVGGVRHVTVTNCTFIDTDRGVHIKPRRGRGRTVEDLRFDTIIMRHVACPSVINGYYQTDIDSDPKPIIETTPSVRSVDLHHITAGEVKSATSLADPPEQRLEGVSFTNVDIDATRPFDASDLSPVMAKGHDQRHGVFRKSLGRVSFKDARTTVPGGSETPLTVGVSSTVILDGFEAEADEGPAVEADSVESPRIGGCIAPDDGEPFARVRGKSDGESSVLLVGNHGDTDEAVVSVQPETVKR